MWGVGVFESKDSSEMSFTFTSLGSISNRANISTSWYNTADLSEEAFLAVVHNHKSCCILNGLTLNPLRLETGGYLSIDYQGWGQPASCNKWNIGSEAITDMLESPMISQVWTQEGAYWSR